MNYQRNQSLAQVYGNFQPVQNGGLAGALAQGLAGFGSGYYGGKAQNQKQQAYNQLAEAMAKGDNANIMNLLVASDIPELQGIGIKTQLENSQKDAEIKRKEALIQSIIGGGGVGGGGDAKSLAVASVIYPELAPLATYTAGQEKQSKEQSTKIQEVTPPGFRVSEGVIPSADDAKKLKSLSEATKNLNRLMDELTDLYKQSGGAQPIGKNADLMRQKYEQAKIQVKNLEELGAIQAPDVPIIEGMIPNPASPIEYGKEQIGIVSIPERANAFKKELDNRVKTRAKTMGYEPLQLPITPDQVVNPAQPEVMQPNAQQQPQAADPNLSSAMQAIQAGAPKDAVMQRLMQNGYSPEQLKELGL